MNRTRGREFIGDVMKNFSACNAPSSLVAKGSSLQVKPPVFPQTNLTCHSAISVIHHF
jgi:hypothetical protein